MPKLSWMTLAKGARQLVVQEALLGRERKTRQPGTAHLRRRMSPHSAGESSRPASTFLSLPDNFQRLVIFVMVDPHHKHGSVS